MTSKRYSTDISQRREILICKFFDYLNKPLKDKTYMDRSEESLLKCLIDNLREE